MKRTKTEKPKEKLNTPNNRAIHQTVPIITSLQLIQVQQ